MISIVAYFYTLSLHVFFYLPAKAEYSCFSADFKLTEKSLCIFLDYIYRMAFITFLNAFSVSGVNVILGSDLSIEVI